MRIHRWSALVLFVFFLSSIALAQAPYSTSPNWTSGDTEVSTGAALVDLDLDGWLDLVVANGNDIHDQNLVVYYNQGDGTFPTRPDWSATDDTYNGHLDVADVNADGWPDVAVVHLLESAGGNSAAKLYLNNNGTLSALPDWSSTEVARSFGIAFGDVNNDGRPDLAVATGWAYSPTRYYKNYVYLNIGGQLENSASWQSNDLNTDQGDLWIDADDDGWLDLAFTGGNDHTRIYRNLGGTLETTASWATTDTPNQDAIMMDAGDVDNDGYRELFVTDNTQLGGSGDFRQYQGLSGGYFTTNPTWSYYDGYGSALALADVDADGDLDLATGAWWDRTRLFLNDGSGYGTSPTWNSAGTSVVEKIVFGDVNPKEHTVKPLTNHFDPDGGRRLFHLSRRHFQDVLSVTLDGVVLLPSQYMINREHGWITVASAPLNGLDVHFRQSVSLDMAVSNWDSTLGNQLYINQGQFDWLASSTDTLSVSTGGSVDLALQSWPENAGRTYLVLGSLSGTAPGIPLPGGLTSLPINWDGFTDLVLNRLNSSLFSDFLGVLDSNGEGSAQVNAPTLNPSKIGQQVHFAYLLEGEPWDFVSNPVSIEFVP